MASQDITNIPLVYVIGDTIDWVDSINGYDNSTFTLKYIFSGGIEVIGVDDGEGWKFTLSSDDLDTAGTVKFTRAIVEDSNSNRTIIDSGFLQVNPDPESETATTEESRAVITLEAIGAVLQGRASIDQSSYSIAGRSLAKTPIGELLELRNYFVILVKKEKMKNLQERGKSTLSGRRVTFSNPASYNRTTPFRR